MFDLTIESNAGETHYSFHPREGKKHGISLKIKRKSFTHGFTQNDLPMGKPHFTENRPKSNGVLAMGNQWFPLFPPSAAAEVCESMATTVLTLVLFVLVYGYRGIGRFLKSMGDLQDPKLEVRQCTIFLDIFWGTFPESTAKKIGLIIMVGTSNESLPESWPFLYNGRYP